MAKSSFICLECSEQVELDNKREFGFCSVCGAKILIKNNNVESDVMDFGKEVEKPLKPKKTKQQEIQPAYETEEEQKGETEQIGTQDTEIKKPVKFSLWFKNLMFKIGTLVKATVKKIPRHGWALLGYVLGIILLGFMWVHFWTFAILGSLSIVISGYYIAFCYHNLRKKEEEEVDKIIGEIARIKIEENGGRLPPGEFSPIDEETEKAIKRHLRYFRGMFWMHFAFASLFVSAFIYLFVDPVNMFPSIY